MVLLENQKASRMQPESKHGCGPAFCFLANLSSREVGEEGYAERATVNIKPKCEKGGLR
jgi:hypothetical protein